MKEIASKTIMIAGGGRIGRRLAESLEGKFDLKIIEINKIGVSIYQKNWIPL